MGAGDRLRDLDSVVLPPLARVLARLGRGPARVRFLSGAALLSVTAVLVTAVWAADRGPRDSAGTPDLLRVGVVEGQSVPGYVRSSRGELAALLHPSASGPAVDTYALVSLTAYLAPDRLAPVLAGVAVAQVYARAPLSGIQTQVVRLAVVRVPEDVVAGMLDTARRRDREQAEFAKLSIAMSEDGVNGDRLREAYATAAQAAAAEALAYRAGCSCVFAAVVHTTPEALKAIAERPEVRAVDPAPEVRHLDRVEFRPPLPEQQTVVPGPSAVPSPDRTESVSTQPVAPAPAAPSAARGTPTAVSTSTSAPVTSASSGDPGADSDPSVGATEESTAVPSALPAGPSVSVPSVTVGASPGASGR